MGVVFIVGSEATARALTSVQPMCAEVMGANATGSARQCAPSCMWVQSPEAKDSGSAEGESTQSAACRSPLLAVINYLAMAHCQALLGLSMWLVIAAHACSTVQIPARAPDKSDVLVIAREC